MSTVVNSTNGRKNNNFVYKAYSERKEHMVFWDVKPFSDVLGYHCFGGHCCLHLQGGVSMPSR